MSDDDDETQAFYAHAIDDGLLGSAADNDGKALKHFNFFLKGSCAQVGIKTVEAKDIPHQGYPLTNDSKALAKFWDQMMGRFVTYLGHHARQACNPQSDPLAFNTADGCLSSTKMFFVNKFRSENPIPVLQKNNTTALRNKLKGLYRERKRGEGQPTKTEGVSSTRQDREAMATACIWIGSPEFAEFWHLLNTSYHCSGRGSEVSLIKSDGVTTMEISELVYKYGVLATSFQRQKTGSFQNLPIYPFRDGLFENRRKEGTIFRHLRWARRSSWRDQARVSKNWI